MKLDQVAWIIRSLMVAGAALCVYILTQPAGTFDQNVILIVGAVNVVLAALNPTTVASKLPINPPADEADNV